MRYTKKAIRNRLGQTTRVDIVDNVTGQVVASFSTDISGTSRKAGVGIANRKADSELNRLNDSAESAGENYDSIEALRAAQNERERRETLDENIAKFEDRITESGRLREELAANLGARTQGQLLNQLTRAILGSGGEMSQVEALTPEIQEASQRSIRDYITGSQATTQQQLAQFIPTEISAEYNQARLQDAMSQFMMNEETQRAQIQAGLDSQPEWWESILGSAGSAAGSAAGAALGAKAIAALSDRRMKERISEVGRLHNGLPVYVFTYKGGTKPQIGVMAQDVEKVNQDAVIEINGIKMVNYEKAVQ